MMDETNSSNDGSPDALAELVANASEKLEQTSETTTSQAFNLGCSVGLIPAGIIILLTAIVSRGNLTAIMISILVMAISLSIFASLAAYLARSRTIDRLNREEIFPYLESKSQELGFNREELVMTIDQLAPKGSPLRRYKSSNREDQSTNPDSE